MKLLSLTLALMVTGAAALAADDGALPKWGMEEVAASRVVHGDTPPSPSWDGDPLNLFAVVEAGDGHLSLIDGDSLRLLARIEIHQPLRGDARISPDGRFLYLSSADGWVSKLDLFGLRVVADVRAGLSTANLTLSHDGRFLMVANGRPHTLVSLDAGTLSPIRVMEVADRKGNSSAVTAIHTVPHRKSFIAALADFKEFWELPYTEDHEPIYNGFVHSREKDMVEGFAEKGPFPARKVKTTDVLGDFAFTGGGRDLVAIGRDDLQAHAINLLTGTDYAQLALPAQPRLGSAFRFIREGREVVAIPHGRQGLISLVDAKTWTVIKRIPTLGEGVSLSGHDGSRRLWVTFPAGKDGDAVQILDLDSLEMVKTWRPAPGRHISSVTFDRRGRTALLTIAEDEAIVVDAASQDEIRRLPMRQPVQSYNVFTLVGANLP